MKQWLTILVVSGVLLAQTPAGLEREGAYWVQTIKGSLPAQAIHQFKVVSVGGVALRGGSERGISYVVRKRVRARTEAEAVRLLAEVRVNPRLMRESGQLVITQPAGHAAYVDIEVVVPKSLRQSVVYTRGGNITSSDLDGGVDVESGGGLIDLDRIGGSATARTGGGEIRVGAVAGSLRCISAGGSIRIAKAGGEAWLETAGGEIEVADSAGPVHASTNGGNIRVEQAGAGVTASTAAGRIEIQHARGMVNAENSAGSIEVGAAAGVRCEASGGAIRLRGTSGTLRAATDTGNILAELISGVALKDSMLSSGAGDVTVLIPSNFPLTVKAQNESGRSARVISEFPEIFSRKTTMAAVAEGSLNGGGPILTISAAGTIYLRRR